jgi:chaperonin GroES
MIHTPFFYLKFAIFFLVSPLERDITCIILKIITFQPLLSRRCGDAYFLRYPTFNNILFEKGGLRMKIKPLNDRILVARVGEEQKSKGGIIIPDTAKEKPQEGKVVEAGPGKLDDGGKRIPIQVKKGDRILFSKYAGNDVKIDGKEYIFMREDDILCVLD